jgi:hypothetical protein
LVLKNNFCPLVLKRARENIQRPHLRSIINRFADVAPVDSVCSIFGGMYAYQSTFCAMEPTENEKNKFVGVPIAISK